MTTQVIVTVEQGSVDAALIALRNRLSSSGLKNFLEWRAWPYLRDRMARRFTGEGDDVVGQWERLKQTTGLIRARQGFPAWHPINVRTGRLRQHVLTSHRTAAVGTTGARLVLPGASGGKTIQAKLGVAQHGDSRAPARPILGVNGADDLFIRSALFDWIRSGNA